jgi:hypothetical protein
MKTKPCNTCKYGPAVNESDDFRTQEYMKALAPKPKKELSWEERVMSACNGCHSIDIQLKNDGSCRSKLPCRDCSYRPSLYDLKDTGRCKRCGESYNIKKWW